jgi:hypothetical protein
MALSLPLIPKLCENPALARQLLVESILEDIREFKQVLISKNIGTVTEIKILFPGDSEPTPVKL